MQTITIISGRKARSEPRIISPGVRQGRTYRVVEEGPDYFLVRLRGKAVMVDKCLADIDDGHEDEE